MLRPKPKHHSSTRTRYVRLLTIPSFRRLVGAQIASEFGDFAGRIALVVLVLDETKSTIGAGAVLAVAALPYLGPGQLLTGWASKFAPPRVLVVADVVRAVCFIAIAADLPVLIRFGLLLIASTAAPVFESTRSGATPLLVPPEQLDDAIGLQVVTNEVSRIIGFALGGVIATTISPTWALLGNAGTFVVSAVLVGGIHLSRTVSVGSRVRVSEGWSAMTSDPILRRAITLFVVLAAFGSVPEALVVPFVDAELPHNRALVGLFPALVSAAIVASVPLLHPPSSHAARVRQAAAIGALGTALTGVLFLLPVSIPSALLAYACMGVPFTARIVVGASIPERLDDRVRASFFSVSDGAISVAQIVAGLGGGALAEAIGVTNSFIAGLSIGAAGALLLRLVPLQESSPLSPQH